MQILTKTLYRRRNYFFFLLVFLGFKLSLKKAPRIVFIGFFLLFGVLGSMNYAYRKLQCVKTYISISINWFIFMFRLLDSLFVVDLKIFQQTIFIDAEAFLKPSSFSFSFFVHMYYFDFPIFVKQPVWMNMLYVFRAVYSILLITI